MSRRPARATSAVARRAVVTLTSACALALLSAGPALAAPNDLLGPQEGADLDSGLSGGDTLLLYVGVPLGLALVITFLFGVRSLARSERYRPGRAWSAAPVWFAGPAEPVAAVEAVQQSGPIAAVRGGASGDW